ncbi:MAG: phytanoyl-CoA dioxygenase family protein [Symploca sp. SIO2E9]|nr:phytanoyl-CoA dioxygenase family protein [Symploca sp. SIO2E9]
MEDIRATEINEDCKHVLNKETLNMKIDEIYEFDLNGYIVYRNFLSQSDVQKINNILDDAKVKIEPKMGKFSFLPLSPYFFDLMAHPKTLEILRVMLGDWFRFDHAIGLEMDKTSKACQPIHAGLLKEQRSFFYQWIHGQMRNGLVKVIYALNDVNPGDGGFVCIPGSHKTNLDYYPKINSHLVVQPTLKAGDMLIFTEALVHGSKKWTAENRRRALIYSYAPGYFAWKNYDSMKDYLKLASDQLQKDLLRPPYVGGFDEFVFENAEGHLSTDANWAWYNHSRLPHSFDSLLIAKIKNRIITNVIKKIIKLISN